MGLFSFLKDAGKKLFNSNDEEKAANPSTTAEAIHQQRLNVLRQHVNSQGINIQNLDVRFEADGDVVLTGEAATKADYEKAALLAGNVAGIGKVDNQMTVLEAAESADSDTYEVQKGDSLWKIAEHYYGNGAKYPEIVSANQPMITNADEIYPGQTLRIPKIQA